MNQAVKKYKKKSDEKFLLHTRASNKLFDDLFKKIFLDSCKITNKIPVSNTDHCAYLTIAEAKRAKRTIIP